MESVGMVYSVPLVRAERNATTHDQRRGGIVIICNISIYYSRANYLNIFLHPTNLFNKVVDPKLIKTDPGG